MKALHETAQGSLQHTKTNAKIRPQGINGKIERNAKLIHETKGLSPIVPVEDSSEMGREMLCE
jgi:hypothetical protein